MKTISILGMGWLGLPLGEFLVSKGFRVKGSTTSEHKLSSFTDLGIQPYLINIEYGIIDEQSKDFFDTDILIITIPPKREVERYKMQMETIAEAIQSHGIQHVVYTSSTGVYGDLEGNITEDTPLQLAKDGSNAVVYAEEILGKLRLNLTICRLGGLIGDNRNPARFLAGRVNLPNGNAPVNLVHQTDCVQVIYQIIVQNAWNEIFNVCADTHPPKSIFYTLEAQRQGLALPHFASDSTPPSAYKTIDNQKVKRILNYEFVYADILGTNKERQ
jgi:nucleoside-diphosphate-sugar epimerase